MVAIVTGTGLGLERSSGWVLGSRGQLGDATFNRFGENVYVNGATGNLVINRTDEILIGNGPDDVISRTYNSLGTHNDENGDNWQLNAARRITTVAGGSPGAAGTTVKLIDGDGSDVLYTRTSADTYTSTEGSGAYDTLVYSDTGGDYNHGTWTWTDGNTRIVDVYSIVDPTNQDDPYFARISTSRDTDGNGLSYTYSTDGLLTKIETGTVAGTGYEKTEFSYSGNNLTDVLTTLADGTLTRVRYGYDGSNRLHTVTTDLSPSDSLVTDGKTVVTTYGYNSVGRINSISQTGLGNLAIDYTDGRVTMLTQTASGVTRVTTFGYAPDANDSTQTVCTINDAAGQDTMLTSDAKGQLVKVELPTGQVINYSYDDDGNVITATDASGNVTHYEYDSNGNLTLQEDAAGNTIKRTYDGETNALLMETRYLVPDPDDYTEPGVASQPVITRFAYDSDNHLRFVVSAEGRVTEYQYYGAGNVNGQGNRKASIEYRDSTYPMNGLGPHETISVTDLTDWIGTIADRSTVMYTDMTYDPRGNLSTTTGYSSADTGGTGVGTSARTKVTYIYDQSGNLLSRQTTGKLATDTFNTESFVYDGLGRLTSSVDLNNATTTILFDDGNNKTTVTLANGFVKTSTYNGVGELVSCVETSDIATAPTYYKYDSLGRLRVVTDAMGNNSYYLYDAVGRKVADIAADGSIVEYGYDASDRLVKTIDYKRTVNSTNLASLVDIDGNPTNVSLASVRPGQSTDADDPDRWEWRIYDDANRLIETIDGKGGCTIFTYDGASNLLSTTSYYNVISPATVSGWKSASTTLTDLLSPTPDSNKDNVSRNFFDDDGRLIGALDGDGYLSQITYDGAGEKTETIAFYNKPTNTTGNFAQVSGSVTVDNTRDIHNRNFYDGRGFLRYTLDASLRPTEYVYDAAGHVTCRIDYKNTIAAGNYSLSYVASHISTTSDDRKSWSVYDAAGNLAYSIDAMGGVTGYVYNAVGQVFKQFRYATLRTSAPDPDITNMTTWVTTNAGADDRVTRMIYDTAGRLAYQADPELYVTEYVRDLDGSVTSEIRYADPYVLNAANSVADMKTKLPTSPPSSAVVATYSYDPAGRLTDSYDGLNVCTHREYDGIGRVTDVTVAYGTSDAVTTHYDYNAAGRVSAETHNPGTAGPSTTTAYTYDGMGNMLTKVDGNGYTTTYTYDPTGKMLFVTVPITATTGATTNYTYDAFGNLSTKTAPQLLTESQRGVTYFFYDKLNRLTLQADAEKYGTAYTYTIGDAVASITRYATKFTSTIVAGTPPNFATSGSDSTTTFTRDKLDRVTVATDAENYYEQYTVNAFGDRTDVWKKSSTATVQAGGHTVNAYDELDRLISETLPINSVRADGTTQATSVTNTFTYDARGNRTSMVEADGLAEERTTIYIYDAADRLTETDHDAVQTVNPTTLLTNSGTTVPKEFITYDKRGNVIKTKDAMGADTHYYYDDLDRKIIQVNALGVVSTWTYNDNGWATAQRVYETPLTAQQIPNNPETAPTIDTSAAHRETTYTYDRRGLVLTTTVAGLRTGQYSGSTYTTAVGDIVLTNEYDAVGDVVRQIDGNGNNVYFYYDKRGGKTAQVDQEKYLTTYALDADGNVTNETRFATKLTGTVTTAAVPTGVGNAADRSTDFTYDQNGRRLTEERNAVDYYTINGSGVLTAHTAKSIVSYTYNGLGEVVTKAEATGDTTTYAYDSGGRQTSVAGPSYTDYNGTTGIQQITQEFYDGLNNVTRTVDQNENASVTNSSDRITTYAYGAGGRLASTTDASGLTTTYGYDAAGRTLKARYQRHKAGGITLLTEAKVTNYDAMGRVVLQSTATATLDTNGNETSWAYGDKTQMQYDSFGEVSARGVNGMYQETFDYDDGGRLVNSTAGDGTHRLYLYDGNGKQTLAISSSGAALPNGYSWSSITVGSAVTLLTSNPSTFEAPTVAGMILTVTVNDKRGQNTQTREPARELGGTGTSTITHSRAYNAFGEVIQETDANGKVTDFTYNTQGKITQKQSPLVSYTDEAGVVHDGVGSDPAKVRPTENYYYDRSGRLLGVQDAEAVLGSAGNINFHTNTRSLLAGTGYDGAEVSVLKEFHADGGQYTRKYDVFGDLRNEINEVGKTETFNYDKMGRLTSQVHEARSDGTQLTDSYYLDEIGNRVRHWNSQLGSGVIEYTDYDAQGRVTRMWDLGGDTTLYSYAWSGSIVTDLSGTSSDWTFGGWTKTTTSPAMLTSSTYRTMTETTDYFGRLVDKVDLGGHDYNFSFDRAGRMVNRTINGTGSITYGYYNTGLAASATQGSVVSSYQYDAQGNRTFEGYVSGSTTYQSATVTWDAMNRMKSFDDATASTGTPSIDWKYDLNGNIRNMAAVYRQLDAQGNVVSTDSTQNYWYKYDSMNRFTVTKGSLSGGVISATGAGRAITYDVAGRRATVTKPSYSTTWDSYEPLQHHTYTTIETELYTYSADGYLAKVETAYDYTGLTEGQVDHTSTMATYTRDAMGRVTDYKEFADGNPTRIYERATTYNNKSQVTHDVATTVRSNGTWTATTDYQYNAETSTGSNNFTGVYQGGALMHQATYTTFPGDHTNAETKNAYVWWDSAVLSRTDYDAQAHEGGSYPYHAIYAYDTNGRLTSVAITDGRPRTVSFITDANGLILQRDEADNLSTGDPRELHYYFNGMAVGDVGNNGTSDIDYAASIAEHTATPGTGPFRNGGSGYINFADFDQSYDPVNGLNYESTSSRYTVQDGDTLEGIAYAIWGDSSFWYMIADANGLSGSETLVAGQDLIIPNKIHNAHNSADTYRVYDPNEAIGNTSPTTPKPQKHGSNGCGAMGQILLVVIAVAVVAITAGAAVAALVPGISSIGAGMGALAAGTTGLSAGALIGIGAAAGAAGSIVSQGVGVATGIQSKFDWGAVAMAAIGGGVGAGLGVAIPGSGFLPTVARGVLGNAITQGIGVATGLQSRFDWAGVAAAGVMAGVSSLVSENIPGAAHMELINGVPTPVAASFGNQFISGMAGMLAGAATRTLVNGSDFGDNIMAMLPDAIGQTIGNAVAASVSSDQRSDLNPASADDSAVGRATNLLFGEIPPPSPPASAPSGSASTELSFPDGIVPVLVTPRVDSNGVYDLQVLDDKTIPFSVDPTLPEEKRAVAVTMFLEAADLIHSMQRQGLLEPEQLDAIRAHINISVSSRMSGYNEADTPNHGVAPKTFNMNINEVVAIYNQWGSKDYVMLAGNIVHDGRHAIQALQKTSAGPIPQSVRKLFPGGPPSPDDPAFLNQIVLTERDAIAVQVGFFSEVQKLTDGSLTVIWNRTSQLAKVIDSLNTMTDDQLVQRFKSR